MGIFIKQQRLIALIACFAIVLAAFSPFLSQQALAAQNTGYGEPNHLGEICSVAGSHGASAIKDPVTAAPFHHQQHKQAHFKHCPACTAHAGVIGLPPLADFILPALSVERLRPFLFLQAVRPLFAWAVAQPRAPPFLS